MAAEGQPGTITAAAAVAGMHAHAFTPNPSPHAAMHAAAVDTQAVGAVIHHSIALGHSTSVAVMWVAYRTG